MSISERELLIAEFEEVSKLKISKENLPKFKGLRLKLVKNRTQGADAWHKTGKINYIPFPAHLKGRYQSFTRADITALRNVGYEHDFKSVEDGVSAYLDTIDSRDGQSNQ